MSPFDSILSPSTALRSPWVGLVARGKTFSSTERSGKWLVMRPPSTVDAAWIQVLALVSTGGLLCAKVSTQQGILMGYPEHAICVYTTDWEDHEDVMRVRQVLRDVGFTEVLRYKRDLDTARGVERFVYEA